MPSVAVLLAESSIRRPSNGKLVVSTVRVLAAAAASLRSALSELSAGQSVLALIGPEGGWTETERTAALAVGARVVRLGQAVLRTETAAVAVCAAMTAIASD